MNLENDSDYPCANKLAFDTKKDAEGAKVTASSRYGSSLHVYKCRYCGLWHIASSLSDES